jgi:hypothetical protein
MSIIAATLEVEAVDGGLGNISETYLRNKIQTKGLGEI